MYYPIQWDETIAEQGEARPEGWGNESALDLHEQMLLEEQARQERAVVRENATNEAA